ncbi:Uncharacterised protein [Mycobacterium tuberculosis]|nr:Uncharacterised protein [Mycobacterium tuberculosis]COX10678.1 Uncharacterised protein [Mycobacterium tuberculosis]COX87489.1 Uncharacterised protein [Mycobacterium tuberculosis]
MLSLLYSLGSVPPSVGLAFITASIASSIS